MNRRVCWKGAFFCSHLLFLAFCSNGQSKEANNWFWGLKSGLSFSTSPPKAIPDAKIYNSFSCSSISDSTGNLLFYTDGGDSLFRNNAKTLFIKNKLGLAIGANHRASLILPNTQNQKRYWVAVISSSQNILKTYPVDMTLDGGKGNIDTTGVQTIDTLLSSTLSVMQHADGKRNWLVGRHFNTDTLVAWMVDTIVNPTPVKSRTFSPYPDYPNSSTAQASKSSPNSEILFWGWGQKETRRNQLIKIDRESGKFYGLIHLVDSLNLNPRHVDYFFPVDAAFSSDSRYLYTVENTYKYPRDSSFQDQSHNRMYFIIRQYDLSVWDSTVIKNSGKVIFQSPPLLVQGPNLVGPITCQLGPDGKIYFQEFKTAPRLSVMHCPNSAASNVNFKYREIQIFGKGGYRLPTLNQTFVRNAGIFQVQANKRKLCKGDTLELSGYGAGAEHFTWSVSPALPASVKVDTLTWQKIATQNIPPGVYNFRCRATSRCGDVFEKSLQVEILPLPARTNLVLQQKPVPCKGDSVIIQVQNPQSGSRYFWSTGDSTSSIVVKQTGLYSLDSVSNSFGCGIKVGDTVAVNIKNAVIPPVPQILGPKLVEICEGQAAQLTIENVQLTVKYRWSNGVEGDSISVGSGQYCVISESSEGCQSGLSDTVIVKEVPNPKPVFVNLDSVLTRESLLNQNYCVSGQPGSRFSFEVSGGQKMDSSENCVTISWTPFSIINYQLSITETLQSPPCTGTQSQTFTYRPNLQIPNLITPNGDGLNDTFVVQDLEFYPNYHLQIFDRWGKRVLNTSAYGNDWSGENGIYFYYLNVDGKPTSGWVQVAK